MAKMTNQNVIKEFLNGRAAESHTGNLYTISTGRVHKLMNYATCLAEYHNGQLLVNTTKYSITTSKIQTYIRSEICQRHSADYIHENVICLDKIQINTSYLSLEVGVK